MSRQLAETETGGKVNQQSIRTPATGAPPRLKWTLALLSLLVALFGLVGTAFAGQGFLAKSYPATVTGKSVSEQAFFTKYAGSYGCKEYKLSGTLNTAVKTLSTTPSWPGECTSPGGSSATWNANGCKFEFTATSPAEEGVFKAEAAIGPVGCGPILVQAPAGHCSATLPPQSGLQATLTNTGSGVLAKIGTSSAKYTSTCGPEGTQTDGSYGASWELAGTTGAGKEDLISISEAFEIAPTVRTEMPIALTSTSAAFTGAINPNALATTYNFEYGKTTSYGSYAPAKPGSAGSGTEELPASEGVSGLSPSTVYHYRLAATNSKGTSYGKDRTFETVASGATPAKMAWPSETSVLTATGNSAQQKLYSPTIPGNIFTCEEATGSVGGIFVSAASTVPVESLSFHNKGSEKCSGPIGTSPTLKTNGCALEFHVGKSIGTHESEGSVSIGKCTSEGAIVASAGICTSRIPELQNLGPVTYKTVGENVEVKLAMKGITVEVSGLCVSNEPKTVSNAEYTGTMLLKGNKGSITVE